MESGCSPQLISRRLKQHVCYSLMTSNVGIEFISIDLQHDEIDIDIYVSCFMNCVDTF